MNTKIVEVVRGLINGAPTEHIAGVLHELVTVDLPRDEAEGVVEESKILGWIDHIESELRLRLTPLDELL